MRDICAFSSAISDVALSEPWLGILPIAFYGSEALREELLPGYLTGRLLPAFALSAPDAGSDARAITTTAHRDGEHYVINGRKTWTSNCGLADLYIVFARMEGPDGSGGIAAFVIDGTESGIALEERLLVLAPHTVGTWTLQDCRIPAHRMIGEPGQGFRIAMDVLELFRPTVGAATLGPLSPLPSVSHFRWNQRDSAAQHRPECASKSVTGRVAPRTELPKMKAVKNGSYRGFFRCAFAVAKSVSFDP